MCGAPMPVVSCSSCLAKLNVKNGMLGMKARCCKCKTIFVIQADASRAPAPISVRPHAVQPLLPQQPPAEAKANDWSLVIPPASPPLPQQPPAEANANDWSLVIPSASPP